MSGPPGTLITSKRLGLDVWLIQDPAFQPNDGLAWFYPDEMPIVGKKTDEQLKHIHGVKLVFPGAKVTDRQFPPGPPLPWVTRYTLEEYEALKKWFHVKYPKENGTFFESPNRACGVIGEFTFDRFLKAWGIKYIWHSNRIGRDDLDFEIGEWMIDLKTQTTPFPFSDDFNLNVLDSQAWGDKTLINIYQWAHWNPTELECTLLGNMTREDFKKHAIATPKGVEVSPYYTPKEDGHSIKVGEARSEARFAWQPTGKVT